VARKELSALAQISGACAERLFSIYGSRAIALAMAAGAGEDAFLDENNTILAAEVAHAINEERARTLVDIMHRRMMVGLLPDQGRALAGKIAGLAAEVAGWKKSETSNQQRMLQAYNDRLRVRTDAD
jgi:glycerol-3-phosphate dehydrogenase